MQRRQCAECAEADEGCCQQAALHTVYQLQGALFGHLGRLLRSLLHRLLLEALLLEHSCLLLWLIRLLRSIRLLVLRIGLLVLPRYPLNRCIVFVWTVVLNGLYSLLCDFTIKSGSVIQDRPGMTEPMLIVKNRVLDGIGPVPYMRKCRAARLNLYWKNMRKF
jgi:hypothetical protein